jgi:hypothetical protein
MTHDSQAEHDFTTNHLSDEGKELTFIYAASMLMKGRLLISLLSK